MQQRWPFVSGLLLATLEKQIDNLIFWILYYKKMEIL